MMMDTLTLEWNLMFKISMIDVNTVDGSEELCDDYDADAYSSYGEDDYWYGDS